MPTVEKEMPDQPLADQAARLLTVANHRWFGGRFPTDGELAVTRLLLGACIASGRGDHIHKKAAAAVMGVGDVRTARKYVTLAEEQGLLVASPDPDDKRRELLKPTPLLKELVHRELQNVAGAFGKGFAGLSAGNLEDKETVSITVSRAEGARYYARLADEMITWKRPSAAAVATIMQHIEMALELDPDCLEALLVRGNLFEAIGMPDKAIAAFERLAALKPHLEDDMERRIERIRAAPAQKRRA